MRGWRAILVILICHEAVKTSGADAELSFHTHKLVALQFSGHLRDLCNSTQPLASPRRVKKPLELLASQVEGCRQHATCDVYMHTWDTLHPHTTAFWHTTDFCESHACSDPKSQAARDASSATCLLQLQRILRPVAVTIERDDSEMLRDDPIFGANKSWTAATGGLQGVRNGNGRSGGLLAGTLNGIHGIEVVSSLRRLHSVSRKKYDLVVRLRPDVHRYGVARIAPCAWPRMLRAAAHREHAKDHGLRIWGCKDARGESHAPGEKNSDTCLWGQPLVLDQLVNTWSSIAVDELRKNACFGRGEQCGLGAVQSPEELLGRATQRANLTPLSGAEVMACSAERA